LSQPFPPAEALSAGPSPSTIRIAFLFSLGRPAQGNQREHRALYPENGRQRDQGFKTFS
jgi:hypothetical protein